MDSTFRGIGDFVPRHELDGLSPTSAISTHLATRWQLADLVAMARREVYRGSASRSLGSANSWHSIPSAIPAFESERENCSAG